MKAFKLLGICVLALALTACSDDGGKKGGGDDVSPNALEWSAVPSEFNPNIEQTQFPISDIKKISSNLFGFSGDVRIRYSQDLSDSGTLDIYSVSKDARTSVRGVDMQRKGDVLEIRRYGSYECSIRITNRRVEKVQGACYVRLVLTLPMGSEIEYSNAGTLISKRFIAMTNEEFLEALDNASHGEHMGVIDAYLSSHTGRNQPALSCEEVQTVIEEFTWKEEKFTVLRKLHKFITDRKNLYAMIEDTFSYFEQEEARRIVGLR